MSNELGENKLADTHTTGGAEEHNLLDEFNNLKIKYDELWDEAYKYRIKNEKLKEDLEFDHKEYKRLRAGFEVEIEKLKEKAKCQEGQLEQVEELASLRLIESQAAREYMGKYGWKWCKDEMPEAGTSHLILTFDRHKGYAHWNGDNWTQGRHVLDDVAQWYRCSKPMEEKN